MDTGKEGKELVKHYERLRLVAYKPTKKDVWTIGFGSTWIFDRPVRQGDVVTLEQAEHQFELDLAEAEGCIHKFVMTRILLTQYQFDALVSFIYNIGTHAFTTSGTYQCLISGKLDECYSRWAKWNKQDGEVLDGLTKRRKTEIELFRTGNLNFDQTA